MSSRTETLLAAVVDGETPTGAPMSRTEALLTALLNGEKPDGTPMSRNEALLYQICEKGLGGGASVQPKDVNFYDYDGTLLHAYTVAEAQALTELPPLPERPGLICQEWNYDLETIKTHNRAVDVGATYTTDDGTTRIYIHLEEGRTSPMLGVYLNGTATVDWGDGTEPDILTGTGTSTAVWTPNHEYAAPGDYVIRLAVDGEMRFYPAKGNATAVLRHDNSGDARDLAYAIAIKRVEIGDGVTSIESSAFSTCYDLSSVVIPDGVTSISSRAFWRCHDLSSVVIPDSVTSIGSNAFKSCCNLSSVVIPDSVTSIGSSAFENCYALSSVVILDGVTSIGSDAFKSCFNLSSVVIPDSVTSIGSYAFWMCHDLSSVVIPDGVTSISKYAFAACFNLSSVVIPDSVKSISDSAFSTCYALSSVVIPDSVTSISSSAFSSCGVTTYDFSGHTTIPTLSNANAFNGIAADCEIRVPAALYDEWIAATNWATYASQIVAV